MTKILFDYGCFSGNKNEFPSLLVKTHELIRQGKFLRIDSVSDKLEQLISGAVQQGVMGISEIAVWWGKAVPPQLLLSMYKGCRNWEPCFLESDFPGIILISVQN